MSTPGPRGGWCCRFYGTARDDYARGYAGGVRSGAAVEEEGWQEGDCRHEEEEGEGVAERVGLVGGAGDGVAGGEEAPEKENEAPGEGGSPVVAEGGGVDVLAEFLDANLCHASDGDDAVGAAGEEDLEGEAFVGFEKEGGEMDGRGGVGEIDGEGVGGGGEDAGGEDGGVAGEAKLEGVVEVGFADGEAAGVAEGEDDEGEAGDDLLVDGDGVVLGGGLAGGEEVGVADDLVGESLGPGAEEREEPEEETDEGGCSLEGAGFQEVEEVHEEVQAAGYTVEGAMASRAPCRTWRGSTTLAGSSTRTMMRKMGGLLP